MYASRTQVTILLIIYRYDVHSKLVSFMAPQNVGTMSNQAR